MTQQGEQLCDGKVSLLCGDCLTLLATLEPNSIDSCVCDPPYHLTSIVKRFGSETAAPAKVGKTGAYARASAGFMGKQWDGGDVAFQVETWRRVWHVLKPGAHLIAFSGTRTYHRMVCAIEDAGFEVRDQIGWAFGQGFPKSHNIGDGWGTALKPAWEPIVLARKPLSESTVAANVLKWGTGALNIDGCRVAVDSDDANHRQSTGGYDRAKLGMFGFGSTTRPANLGNGRWPANVIHDGSDEVVGAFPDNCGQTGPVIRNRKTPKTDGIYGEFGEPSRDGIPHDSPGSAARFFYTAKADSDDRLGSKHPTVKPLDLMQYLCRLVTPPKGTVLDCFAGTGTTGEAAFREGMRAVLIEREPEYQNDIIRPPQLLLLFRRIEAPCRRACP